MHLTDDDLAFLARFAKTPDGEYLGRLLTRAQGGIDTQLRTASGEVLFRLQGRAQQLEDTVKWVSGRSSVVVRRPPPSDSRKLTGHATP